jgi:Holliday junction resolvase-like predicted endonuclease
MLELQAQEEHELLVSALETRLRESGKYKHIKRHVFYGQNRLIGEADITARFYNRLVYFEVKIHENESSFYKAKKQIERFKKYHNSIECTGVYVTPTRIKRVYL